MRFLLDTHALIWAAERQDLLGPAARSLIQEESSDLLISAATIWEVAIKCGRGTLGLSLPYRPWFEGVIRNRRNDDRGQRTEDRKQSRN